MSNYKRINPQDWYYLGQWVAPILETDLWVDWCELNITKKITSKTRNPDLINLNGRHYLWNETFEDFLNESYKAAKNHRFTYYKNFIWYVKNAIQNLLKVEKRLIRKKELEFHDLNEFLSAARELRGPWMSFNPLSEGLEKFLNHECKKNNIEYNQLSQSFQPTKKLWVVLQHQEVRQFVKDFARRNLLIDLKRKSVSRIKTTLSKKYPGLWQMMQLHVGRFAWIGTHNFWGTPLTIDKLIMDIKREAENYPFQKVSKPKIKVPNYFLLYINLIRDLIYWRFRCAEASSHSSYFLRKYLIKVARKLGVGYTDLIWFTTGEILSAYKDAYKLKKEKVIQRKKGYGIIYINRGKEVITDKKLKFFESIFQKGRQKNIKVIRGSIAYKGQVKGKARIILKTDQMKKFKKDEILIAPETTPDFVPAMKVASAIVTDLGGITCHAAIVSREFKIPCIIGTKHATQILKDGDLVEVDADKGIIKML